MRYYTTTQARLPAAWRAAGGIADGASAVFVIAAHTRRDVAPLLTDRGMRQAAADTLADAVRPARETPPGVQLLMDAGAVRGDRVDVLFWRGTGDKSPVVRADVTWPGQPVTLTVVGRFRRDGADTYAEALGEAGACPTCDSADVCTLDPAPPSTDPTHHVCQACGHDWPAYDLPVGTAIRYWTGVRQGEGKTSRTRSEPRMLGGHTSVVWVEGESSCIALTHIEVIA